MIFMMATILMMFFWLNRQVDWLMVEVVFHISPEDGHSILP
jgi:hypothetical protein